MHTGKKVPKERKESCKFACIRKRRGYRIMTPDRELSTIAVFETE
jgi:hypothetical protein